MTSRFSLAVCVATLGGSAGFGQDYIKSVFGLGKKAAPKSEPIPQGFTAGQIPEQYLLKRENGPFHIFVASYVGDRGVEYAMRLASELRNRHGFEAFIHNHRAVEPFWTPKAEELAKMRHDFLGKPPRPRKLKTPIQDNWVVVVGNFPSMENDRAFDSAMKKLKRLTRDSFSPEVAAELRWGTEANRKKADELVGLRGTANPQRPREHKWTDEQIKTFKLLKEMNDPEEYSVYKLRAPYTMFVYKFSAATGIAKEKKKSIFGGDDKATGLITAANNARIFCKVMRDMGYEAYIFHSDIASCVCINGYEGPNDPKWLKDYQKFAKMKIFDIELKPDLKITPQDPSAQINAN